MSEQQLAPDVAQAVSVLVRHGYDLSKLGIPGAPVRLSTPKEVFEAIERRVIDPREARPVLGFPPYRGPLERLRLGVAAALQVVVAAFTIRPRPAVRRG